VYYRVALCWLLSWNQTGTWLNAERERTVREGGLNVRTFWVLHCAKTNRLPTYSHPLERRGHSYRRTRRSWDDAARESSLNSQRFKPAPPGTRVAYQLSWWEFTAWGGSGDILRSFLFLKRRSICVVGEKRKPAMNPQRQTRYVGIRSGVKQTRI
jgi:hypothetical protein